jgi:DNA-binding NarL/FixJ family response regulator
MNPNTPNLAIHPIRIFILDNHNLVRAGLQLLLDNGLGIEVVGEAGQLDEAIELITNYQPDIILFELNLEDQFTTEIISSLLNVCETARLILVTATTDAKVIQNAVEAGVMGVVFKTQSPEVLIKAIEKVNYGEVWLERSMIANVLSNLSHNKNHVRKNSDEENISQLSNREKEVIQLIAQGYKNKRISAQLCISETTVRHHLTSIYSKLGVSDRLELLIFAHRFGLVKSPNS